jgi:ABC-2 type transport system ATP-binding protein
MIEVRDLSKRYGDKLAVDHLTFTVRPGMVTGFLGPNGAGKSTTMRLILGSRRARSTPAGRPTCTSSPSARRTACPAVASTR